MASERRPPGLPDRHAAVAQLPHEPARTGSFGTPTFRGGETVPCLRLSGRWLEQRGFGVGAQVYVEAGEGRLILTNYKTPMAELFGSSE